MQATGLRNLLICTLVAATVLTNCKSREEGTPDVQFSFSKSPIKEGDTIRFINTTANGSVFEWKVQQTGWVSNNREANYIFTQAGTYEIILTAKNGDGLSATKTQTIEVLPDSVYRLSNNKVKTWIVKSIVYNGNELVKEPCQMDDEFTVYRGAMDTCTITEAQDTCPGGTYLFELPATSAWRFNSKNKAFEFALTAFGSPINFSFVVQELTHDKFTGFDALNGVTIKMEKK